MSTFASELQDALQDKYGYADSNEGIRPGDATIDKLRTLLDAPDSLRRTIVLRILERRATYYMRNEAPWVEGYGTPMGAIDWSQVPWEQIITGLLKVLLMILPFIL